MSYRPNFSRFIEDMSIDPIINLLRSRTSNLHESVHNLPLMQRLLSQECSLTDYQRVLVGFYRFHCRYNGLFSILPKEERFSLQAPALVWLDNDLAALGVEAKKLQCPLKSSKGTLEDYLAFMYVTQGSTLGGQQILKHLKSRFESQESSFSSEFYQGYGRDTGKVWREFQVYLEGKSQFVDYEKVALSAELCFKEIIEDLGYE